MPPKRYFEQSQDGAAASSKPEAVDAAKAGPSKAAAAAADSARKSTLFVSRLPFSATTTDLQTLFSDVGPLRRAFVVTDPNTKTSKGVGYVTFAVPEDAERALTELQGRKLDGKRAIAISWADAKPAKGETYSAEDIAARKRQRVAAPASGPPAAARTHDPTAKDPDAIRTVILSGLATCKPAADSKTLYKRARKIGDVENVLYPFANDSDVAHVVFRTPNHAAEAVTKLHAHTFKGAQLSAVLKKRADGAAKLNARMRPETKERMEKMRLEVAANSKGQTAAPLPQLDSIPVAGVKHDSRLIIRNLPFDVDAADLRAVFLPFGPVYKIDVPQKVAASSDKEAKTAPPAPIEVKDEEASDQEETSDDDEEDSDDDEEDEENEEEDVESNEEEGADAPTTEIKEEEDDAVKLPPASATASTPAPISRNKGRGFAFVWMVSRADAARALEGVNGRAIRHGEAEKVAAKIAKGSRGRQTARAKLKAVRDSAQPERVVAVDWALGKSEWQKKEEEAQDDDAEEEGDDDDEAGSDEDDSDDDAASASGSETAKPALPTPSEGTTLFVRNLPFEATEPELLGLFKQFGPVRYARITMDRSTDPPRSKGTGFVCFWNRDDAVEALRRAREVEEEAGTNRTTTGGAPTGANATAVQNPFSMTTSVLTADPSAPLTASFNLRGRILNVIPAVEREKADMLTAAGAKARQKQDKRNTYLMREGVPLPNTDLASQLSSNDKEIERRLASFTQRKSQLAVNPSLFISKTRLSVRQLPLFCTDRMLKRLAIHAIKTFKAEATAGSRPDLDADELADRTFSPASKPPKKGERSTSVVQSKIVKALDRPDPITGAPGGRSKGFGFLEMRSFHEALRVLRWANANKDVQKLMAEWHVEELEDLKKKMETELAASPGNADLSTRLKRVSGRLDDFKRGGASAVDKAERGGLLFVEFAIENATVVKQRRDRAEQNRRNAERRKARDAGEEVSEDEEVEEGEEEEEEDIDDRGRAPRRANWNQSTKKKGGSDDMQLRRAREQASNKVSRAKNEPQKMGQAVGGVIGRKRAERKKGRK
ncbi:hypothetical protein BDZ90DRAFT_17291 [Jaminaea rosea]|uniref:RRM domain-containing protein n=1 Tax=Jaminaea rosea TaxID=1569628 RepID=A0A316UZZ6_9BASI|nr:hypothetical protein BDZ90DRAFT_17291 [Jaminaea rosea]PWN30554.1 hypothetical protein BDZ90DRAFT_17291 [Jaminaea rosea]